MQCKITSVALLSLACLKNLRVLSVADTFVVPFAVEKLLDINKNLEIKGVKVDV